MSAPLAAPLDYRSLSPVSRAPNDAAADIHVHASSPVPVELTHATRPAAEQESTPVSTPSDPPAAPDRAMSDETARDSEHASDTSAIRKRRTEELGEPSDAQIKKAGVMGTVGAGAGGMAAAALANSARREPQGWRDVDVEDKHQIWSPMLKKERLATLKKAGLVFGFITLWLWACLSLFWGSTYQILNYLPNLGVYLIPLDEAANSFLNGPFMEEVAYQQGLSSSVPHLGWTVRDPALYPNGLADVYDEVMRQDCWAALVINANATSAWVSALQNGDASYDPTGAMGFYYQSARFYQVILLYFDSLFNEFALNPLATARANALEYFIQSYQGNETALTLAAQVPQAVGVAFSYTTFDLRPIGNNQWAAAAPMEAGLIYFVIFAFYIALFAGIARMKTGLASKLRFPAMLGFRMAWPVFCYFWMSLAFTTIERAWQVPLENVIGRAGFPALWALNFVTIWAAGWAMETVTALVGPQNLPFFLILWIISSSFFPIELMNRFYRLLRFMPFLHNIEGFKIIAFGTNPQHRLGLHYGVLFAIIGVELICYPLSILFERWTMDKGKARAQAAEEREKREEA